MAGEKAKAHFYRSYHKHHSLTMTEATVITHPLVRDGWFVEGE